MIDRINEIRTINTLINKIPKVDSDKTIIINVEPLYSSYSSQMLSHGISKGGALSPIMPVDIPLLHDNFLGFELKFIRAFREVYEYFDTFIIHSHRLYTSDFDWIVNSMTRDFSVETDRIIKTATFKSNESIVAVDYVGQVYDGQIKFSWEV